MRLALHRERLASGGVEVLGVVEPRGVGALALLDEALERHQRAARRACVGNLVVQQVDELLVRALHLAHDLLDGEAHHVYRQRHLHHDHCAVDARLLHLDTGERPEEYLRLGGVLRDKLEIGAARDHPHG